MTNTILDSPPHYAIQDGALIRLALAGRLIAFVRSDQSDEWWYHLPAPNMVIGNEISRDHLTEDCAIVLSRSLRPHPHSLMDGIIASYFLNCSAG
jgi:hypothetical protein